MPPTLIDVLQQTDGYPIDNMAHWGDTLAEMIQAGQFWPPLIAAQADAFLFSGGWQRCAGRRRRDRAISESLRCGAYQTVRLLAYYIKPEFYDNLS